MSLRGAWTLVEADAVRTWPSAPFPLSLIVKRNEQLIIDYLSTESLEEISISLLKDNKPISKTYIQRGKLNFQKLKTVSIVASSDRLFQELSLLHIGSQVNVRPTGTTYLTFDYLDQHPLSIVGTSTHRETSSQPEQTRNDCGDKY